MIKLVVCDLDGTLLPRGEEKLDSRVFEMISALKNKNISFAVASGRSYHELKRLFQEAEQEIYFIASDGALTVHKEKNIFENPVSDAVLARVAQAAYSQGLPGIMLGAKYLSYYICSCPKFANYVQKNLHHHALEVSRAQEIKEPIYKVSLYRKNKILLPPDVSRQLSEVYDGGSWQDFVANGTDKAVALKMLQKELGILPEQTAVFGDNSNDVGMLSSTPYSYAVSGGSREAQLAGKHRTSNVLKTIEELIMM